MRIQRLSFAVPFTLVLALGGACQSDAETSAPSTTPDATCSDDNDHDCVEMATGALVLAPEDDTKNGIHSLAIVDATTFDVTGTGPGLGRFVPGATILRGIPGFGLVIGRITAVTPTADGQRVKFERTRIQDVIPRARIRTRQHVVCAPTPGDKTAMTCEAHPVTPGPLWGTAEYLAAKHVAAAAASALTATPAQGTPDEREAALGISNCTRDFIDNGTVTLGLDSCHFTVSFDVDLNLSWGLILPDGFSASVTFDADAGLSLSGQISAGFSDADEAKLVSLGTVTFTVGGIPMYVSGSIFGGYTLDASGDASFEAGFEYDASETFGFGWAKGDGLYKIRDASRTSTHTGPTFSLEGHADATAYLRPELELGVGVSGFLSAGATIGLEVGARLDLDVSTQGHSAQACASLDLYATPSLGYDLDIFGLVDQNGSFALADWSKELVPTTCVGADEQEDPACGTGSTCNSDADCEFKAGATVTDAPDGVTPALHDSICIEPSCEPTSGTQCGCAFAWKTNCCTSDAQCGDGAICSTSVHQCVCPIYGGQCGHAGVSLEAHPLMQGFAGVAMACHDDADCDDGREMTTDTCSGGDCTHRYAGPTPAMIQCTSDAGCDATQGGHSFCMGGACLAETIDVCDLVSCDDGNSKTIDSCDGGACRHVNVSILQPVQ